MSVLNFSSLDALIEQTDDVTARYVMYGGEVELLYVDNQKEHSYYRDIDGGRIRVWGVTNITGSADKPALKPWVAKENADAMLHAIREYHRKDTHMVEIDIDDFDALVVKCKGAYRDKTDKACDVGHIAHKFVEDYLRAKKLGDVQTMQSLVDGIEARVLKAIPEGEFERDDAVEQCIQCCNGAVSWLVAHNFRPIKTEYKLYSRDYNFAGTTDAKGLMDSCSDPECCDVQFTNWLVIADWKSSRDFYIEYRYQAAAYDYADEEESGDKKDARVVVELGKYTGIVEGHILLRDELDADFNAFLGLMAFYERSEALRDVERAAVAGRKQARAEKKAAKEKALQDKRDARAAKRAEKAEIEAAKPKRTRKKKDIVQ